MLSFTREDFETFTRPLCSPQRYAAKLANYDLAERSFLHRDERSDGLPVNLHVEATANCNLPCPVCPRGINTIQRSGHLSLDNFVRTFDLMSSGLGNICISGWGEPLLNPALSSMIAKATGSGVSVFLNSNGTVLEDKVDELLDANLTVIAISMDGAVSRPTHAYTDRFTFESVVRSVETLARRKAQGGYAYPLIQGKFIVTEETVGEIERLQEWAWKLGVEHVKFKRQFETMPGQVARDELESERDLHAIEQHGQVRSTEDAEFTPLGCSHPWSSLFLSAGGVLGLCSWDPHQVYALGRAGDAAEFQRIWNGEAMRKVRRWQTGRGAVGEPCRKCNRLPGYLRQDVHGSPPSAAGHEDAELVQILLAQKGS